MTALTNEQMRGYRARYKAKMVNYINERKSVPCTDCGENYPPCVMDFDHVRGTPKKMALSHMSRTTYSLKSVAAEIDKCDVVCANCHRIREQWRRDYIVLPSAD